MMAKQKTFLSRALIGFQAACLTGLMAPALAAPPPVKPGYVPGRQLEGDADMFGEWEFTTRSVARTEKAIEPRIETIRVCLKEGMNKNDLPLMAVPRAGRCVLSGNTISKTEFSIMTSCDEGERGSSISIFLEPQPDGTFKGKLDYSLTFSESRSSGYARGMSGNSESELTARHIGNCPGENQ